MGYDMWDAQNDAAWDEMQERIAEELYPEHKDRAIGEFSDARLRSYYLKNRRVMCPAIHMMSEAKKLLGGDHYSAAVVFYATAIELLLKATILRPVVAGLVHIESLAEVVMNHTLAKDGYVPYVKLLKQVFLELADVDLEQTRRDGVSQTLWEECGKVRKLRNDVVHGGATRTKEDAELARLIALAVIKNLVFPVLAKLGMALTDDRTGELCDA